MTYGTSYKNIFSRGRKMNNPQFVLSCCSTADLTAEQLKERNISWIPFHFFLDDKEYPDDLGKSISFEDFYKAMENGASTRTSQVNSEEYLNYFESFLKEGKDVLHVTLSSGISGTYNSAVIAAEELKEKYPERKLYIVDSLGASSGYGLLMEELADERDKGKSVDEVKDFALSERLKINHWFFSTDLTFYVKGGRISKASGWFGTVLKICPLLNVDREGKLIPRKKVQGKKLAVKTVVQKMEENAEDGLNYSGRCLISHSACLKDAEAVRNLIEEKFPNQKGNVIINSIGTTIGAHTGPGTVALFFRGKERED